jgi:hypothetical protein
VSLICEMLVELLDDKLCKEVLVTVLTMRVGVNWGRQDSGQVGGRGVMKSVQITVPLMTSWAP